MTVLAARGLTLTARIGGRDVEALRDINFELGAGKVLGLVGESGAGKSMIGRVVAGLLPSIFRVTAGTLEFRGTDLVALPPDRHRALLGKDIAFIPQEPMTALNPVLTIGQQFSEHLARLGHGGERARRDMAAAQMSAVRLPDPAALLDRYPHQLSGGMCQRVLTAMAFAGDPALLIADEPTTALDVTIQAQIVELVKRLRDDIGMAIIWITHDLGVVAGLADRMMVMYAGHVVEEAPVKEVYADPRHPYTLGLLLSLPRLDVIRAKKLTSIEGLPPDLIALPPGCPFAPRCVYAIDKCREVRPELEPVGPKHRIACWVDVTQARTN